MKYTAINIGPIYKTLEMARKPRELWATSYLFSHLMRCICGKLEKDSIVSPCVKGDIRTDVGLYPDRVYVNGEVGYNLVEEALKQFATDLQLNLETVNGYFKVILCTAEADTDSEAIQALNGKLDCLELFETAVDIKHEQAVKKLITLEENSPLFHIAFHKSFFSVKKIEYVAENGRKDSPWSYNNYFCVVQADGDRMGKAIASASGEKLKQISAALLNFGNDAVTKIKEYAKHAVPIYAGGDDLLFLAPVVGDDGNIFDLIKVLDSCYEQVQKVAGTNTSMSYGIAISYYECPLYECFEAAHKLLFSVAKEKRNTVAWSLRKHSGGTFAGKLSKEDSSLYQAFENIMKVTSDADTVSAVAHKIRINEGLLELWAGKEDCKRRNANFFEMYMDSIGDSQYKQAALELLDVMTEHPQEEKVSDIVKIMYGMLRTAKFVKGEKEHE